MARVLVVDDSKLIRMTMKGMLEELGHEVVALAEDGEIGYEKYKEFIPDIVTMDINMPNLDGISALRKILKEFPKAKVIMASSEGEGNRGIVYDCLGEGALDFIDKPVQKEQLEKKINQYVK